MPGLATAMVVLALVTFSALSSSVVGQIVLAGLLSHPLIKPIQQGISLPSEVTRSLACNQPMTMLLGKLVTVRASQVCQDFSLDRPSLLKCSVMNLADQATQSISTACRPHEQAPVKSTALDGTSIPVLLPDKRPIPAGSWEGKARAQLLADEGPTYYWHVTNVINLFLWAPCHPIVPGVGVPKNSTDWLVPEGWTNVKMIYVVTKSPRTPEAVNSTRLPAIANLKSADGSRLDIIVRGTRTALEWQVDFTYQQRRDPAYPGLVSLGFSRAADYVWPMLKPVLDEQVLKGTVKHVTISGHSLGAALSTLLSYRMQVYFDEQLTAVGKKPLVVTALLFACPNVGNDEFVTAFNKKVNARRITFGIDVVPQVPCAPQMLACADPANSSYVPQVLNYNYQQVGGNIAFEPAEMPVQQEAWGKMDTINACKMLPWAIASHVCSYPCYFSKFVNATEYSRCRLWGDQAVPAGEGYVNPAYCVGYPQDSPTYPTQLPARSKLVLGRR